MWAMKGAYLYFYQTSVLWVLRIFRDFESAGGVSNAQQASPHIFMSRRNKTGLI